MNEDHPLNNHAERAPEAQVSTKRGFSIIWVVPIVALLIGGWLAFKAWSERGPVVTITFESADGLEADKTKIKFKDVEIGKVTAIELDRSLDHVLVTAEMHKNAAPYLTDQTRFWVVRARVAAGEVSGLGTLFSGAYIGIDPRTDGQPSMAFKGLEKPPLVTADLPGRHYVLEADSLGSLDVGSPVYYRGIKVGQVVEYGFDELAEAVNVRVFVNAPYHEKIRQNTRFWNASGIDVKLDTAGIKVDTQSLVSIMLGGVAFDLPKHLAPADQAEPDRVFQLYESREGIEERTYLVKRYYMMYFDQNIRGLEPGAPVEFRGIQLGEVVDVKLEVNADDMSVRVPVKVMIEPERVDTYIDSNNVKADRVTTAEEAQENMMRLVARGMRAQLKTGNLLTGQLYVDLDFYPDAPKVEVTTSNGYPVVPTIPAPLEQIAQRVNNILKQVEKIPFDQIGKNLQVAVTELNAVLNEVKAMSGSINGETIPRINASLEAMQSAMNGLEATLGPDSALNYNASQVTKELSVTIRSLRSLLDYLERDPQALLLGKEEEKP